MLLTTAYSKYTWVHVKSDTTTWCGEWRAGEDMSAGDKVPSMLYFVVRDESPPAADERQQQVGNSFATEAIAGEIANAVAPGLSAAFDAAALLAADEVGVGGAPAENYRLLDKDGTAAWNWCA